MGLTVKVSNGQSVVCPDPIDLLKACEEYGHEGEDVEKLRRAVASRCSRPKQPTTLSRLEGRNASFVYFIYSGQESGKSASEVE
jgi:hypothetical protein